MSGTRPSTRCPAGRPRASAQQHASHSRAARPAHATVGACWGAPPTCALCTAAERSPGQGHSTRRRWPLVCGLLVWGPPDRWESMAADQKAAPVTTHCWRYRLRSMQRPAACCLLSDAAALLRGPAPLRTAAGSPAACADTGVRDRAPPPPPEAHSTLRLQAGLRSCLQGLLQSSLLQSWLLQSWLMHAVCPGRPPVRAHE